MWKSLVLLGAIGLTLPVYGESQRVSGLTFEKVLVVGPVEVEIEQGTESQLVLRGGEADLEKQPFFLKGDVLVLGRSKAHRAESFDDVQYKVTASSLRQLQVDGSGTVYVKPLIVRDFLASIAGSGELKMFGLEGETVHLAVEGSGDLQLVNLSARDLRVVLSGSGDIAIGQLVGSDVEVSLRGSGDITVSEPGEVETLEVNVVGSGDIDLSSVNAALAEVNIMGSGDASVGTVVELEVNIVGSGDVAYRGDPELDRNVLGSGDLHRAD